jgi:hypothetical protein
VANHGDAAGMLVPFGAVAQRAGRARAGPHRRRERILEQRVLDVGQQQLLVLLLVGDAELDQRGMRRIGQQRLHRLVDVRAPGGDLVERRAATACRVCARECARLRLRSRN